MIYKNRIRNILGDFGVNWVHFGSKIGIYKIALEYGRMFYHIERPNDNMKHPCVKAKC
jgi:hypothetical protein